MDQLTLSESDEIVKNLKAMKTGTFTIRQAQSSKIKQVWQLLHWYDPEHEYTISQDNLKLRKDKR
jgi:hypothetical protein